MTKSSSIWENNNFILLWTANILSNFGTTIYLIALPMLLYEITRSALIMSTFRAIDMVPGILIGIFMGVIVDRYSRKLIMSLSVIIQILTLSTIIFLTIYSDINLWLVYLMVFFLSLAGNTFWTCQTSIMPQIVRREHLTEVNAKIALSNNLITTIGPSIAGIIIATFSIHLSLSLYLVCMLLSLIVIYFIQVPHAVKKQNSNSYLKEIKVGIDELVKNSTLYIPTLVILVKNLSNSLIIGVLIFYLIENLNATNQEIGFVFTIGGLGGIIGSLIITRLVKKTKRGKVFIGAIFVDIIGLIGLIFSNIWWLVGISFFIRTLSGSVSNIIFSSLRQEYTPNHILGRVVGVTSMLVKITFPLGLLLSGIWAEFLPIKFLFIIATLIIVILFFLIRNHSISNVS